MGTGPLKGGCACGWAPTGDPAAVPAEVWQEALRYADAAGGYTHQAHRREFQQELLTHLMVSADTPAAAPQGPRGLRTFRVKAQGDPAAG